MAWTSPRTTQVLHQRRDLARLAHIDLVAHELSCFRRKIDAAALALRRFGNRLPRSLGPAHATVLRDLVERAKAVLTESQ